MTSPTVHGDWGSISTPKDYNGPLNVERKSCAMQLNFAKH